MNAGVLGRATWIGTDGGASKVRTAGAEGVAMGLRTLDGTADALCTGA
jgi:hypothetical protein